MRKRNKLYCIVCRILRKGKVNNNEWSFRCQSSNWFPWRFKRKALIRWPGNNLRTLKKKVWKQNGKHVPQFSRNLCCSHSSSLVRNKNKKEKGNLNLAAIVPRLPPFLHRSKWWRRPAWPPEIEAPASQQPLDQK